MSQVDHDPLCRVKGLKKLECFNKKKFKELKDIFKKIAIVHSLKKKKKLKKDEEKREERFVEEIELQRDILFTEYKDKEEVWMDKEKWDMVIDFENYWGDLSIEEEEQISRLLRGKDNKDFW